MDENPPVDDHEAKVRDLGKRIKILRENNGETGDIFEGLADVYRNRATAMGLAARSLKVLLNDIPTGFGGAIEFLTALEEEARGIETDTTIMFPVRDVLERPLEIREVDLYNDVITPALDATPTARRVKRTEIDTESSVDEGFKVLADEGRLESLYQSIFSGIVPKLIRKNGTMSFGAKRYVDKDGTEYNELNVWFATEKHVEERELRKVYGLSGAEEIVKAHDKRGGIRIVSEYNSSVGSHVVDIIIKMPCKPQPVSQGSYAHP